MSLSIYPGIIQSETKCSHHFRNGTDLVGQRPSDTEQNYCCSFDRCGVSRRLNRFHQNENPGPIFIFIYLFLPQLPCSRIACCEVPPVPFLHLGTWRSTGEDNRPSTVCACWDRIGRQGEVCWNEPLRLQLCAETIGCSADRRPLARGPTALRLITVLFFKVAVCVHCSVTLPPQLIDWWSLI